VDMRSSTPAMSHTTIYQGRYRGRTNTNGTQRGLGGVTFSWARQKDGGKYLPAKVRVIEEEIIGEAWQQPSL